MKSKKLTFTWVAVVGLILLAAGAAMLALGAQDSQGSAGLPPSTTARPLPTAEPTELPPAGEAIYLSELPQAVPTAIPIQNAPLSFSPADYFHTADVRIALTAQETGSEYEIYYTMDGSEPDQSDTRYTDEILLTAPNEAKAYSISARVFYADGTISDTYVHTYFVGKNVQRRYDTLVLSVTTDPYNLYDYEYGIFVEGKIRDEYLAENPRTVIDGSTPANWSMRGKDSERPVYLEIIDADGAAVLGQSAGVRMYGGWSRAHAQKPIKLFARKEYDAEHSRFDAVLFPNATAQDGTIIDSFKRLVVRSCGNDNGFGFIRDEFFQRLAKEAGYADTKENRPCALYVNGEYFGFYWLHEVYHESYFESHYGSFDGNMVILEGGELYKNPDPEEPAEVAAAEEYTELYEKYSTLDLTDNAVYEELCEALDVENYLAYYAFQIYIGNKDWPGNNYKVYRYYAAEGESYREAPFDGKWRYLLHDLDFSFGIYGESALERTIGDFVTKNGVDVKADCPLFGKLMQRDDCKRYFVLKSLDLANGVFHPDYLGPALDQMNQSRTNELSRTYATGKIADWVNYGQLEGRMQNIKDYALQRQYIVQKNYLPFFKLSGIVWTLTLTQPEGCGVQLNDGFTVYRPSFTGQFYSCYDTLLTPVLPMGIEFDHWVVNGVPVMDEVLVLSESTGVDRNTDITLITREAKEKHPIVSELSYRGGDDCVTLYNPYSESISLRGYRLSDDADDTQKYLLPELTLAAGETLRLVGEGYSKKDGIGKLLLNFNLKEGEQLILSYDKEVIDTIYLPMSQKGTYYRRNLYTGIFETVMQAE